MSYLMTKLLPLLVYPLGLSILLLLGALLWQRRKPLATLFVVTAVMLLWICSTPRFSDWLMATLEDDYPPTSASTAPEADAIVLLGGMIRGRVPGADLPDLSDSVDRLFHAAALYRAGKAPVLVLTGGNAEGYEPEAVAMGRVLETMGINREVMVLEDKSRNTHQNARNTAPILNSLQAHSILLVTSAYHMSRAMMEFRDKGVKVYAAATDYRVVDTPRTMLDWLPSSGALNQTTIAIKEYLGMLVAPLR
ncbi:YdcF family protein [Thiolapillus brandeum]|uniref:DUF218 domain-containing protein n=1 Tax=Thiolapillus brandeum TaxID=1076588 RepID=A0A7U6GHF3_9GAMM|nr:YdcF family protein [Thiolapillus brandeum]BAO43696.1 hypothetical protein TBH_C0759 [Thiolapillus brandeum]